MSCHFDLNCSYSYIVVILQFKSLQTDLDELKLHHPTLVTDDTSLIILLTLTRLFLLLSLQQLTIKKYGTTSNQQYLCQRLFSNKVAGLRPATLLKKSLWHGCFPLNFAKFLRTSFLQNTSGRLFLNSEETKPLKKSSWSEIFAALGIASELFFFLSGFSFTNIHESLDCRGRGRAFL